jgi:hypothetical protein
MADIRVTSTGKIFYRVDDCTAALLLEALPASFERVKPPAPPVQTAPQLFIAPGIAGGWGIHCKYPTGETRSVFESFPKEQVERYFGLPIPDGLWQQLLAAQQPIDMTLEGIRQREAARR